MFDNSVVDHNGSPSLPYVSFSLSLSHPSVLLPLRRYLPVPIESHPIHQAPFLLMKLSTIAMFSLITIRRSTFLEKKQFLFAVVTILPPVLVYGIHIYPYIHKNSLFSGEPCEKTIGNGSTKFFPF